MANTGFQIDVPVNPTAADVEPPPSRIPASHDLLIDFPFLDYDLAGARSGASPRKPTRSPQRLYAGVLRRQAGARHRWDAARQAADAGIRRR
jgi:hypothetical protein